MPQPNLKTGSLPGPIATKQANSMTDQRQQLYKVVKIGRKSTRRQILERGLTKPEAQRVVQRYPDSRRSMVVFEKQKPFNND